MKTLKLLFAFIISGAIFSSCTVVENNYNEEVGISLEEVVSGYDVWYVDYHRTTGSGDVPYVSKAFTLSFLNGTLYANNNIADIGRTGNGLGIDVGTYYTDGDILETNHDLDGRSDFEVYQISSNEIRLYNYRQNVNYYLIGYQTHEFDYDKLFYENIEYFLQEYIAWKQVESTTGAANEFDNEMFLQFTPEDITTFYSSTDPSGTNIDTIHWDFVGNYEVFDVIGYEDLKILTLNYDGGYIEEFELSVINDQKILLYHIDSETTYSFSGRGFVQYLKGGESKSSVRNSGRKRTKVKRQLKIRRNLK
mgnify:CR=1 FL=1